MVRGGILPSVFGDGSVARVVIRFVAGMKGRVLIGEPLFAEFLKYEREIVVRGYIFRIAGER